MSTELTDAEVNAIGHKNGYVPRGDIGQTMEAWQRGDTVVVMPRIFPGCHPDLHQRILNRRLMYFVNKCPCCGAVPMTLNRAQRRALKGQVVPTKVWHEHDCLISDDAILAVMQATQN